MKMSQQPGYYGSGSVTASTGYLQSPRVFDEPLAFRIRHIQADSPSGHPGAQFRSGRWKPPTVTHGVRLLDDVRYICGDQEVSQDTIFVWRPPLAYYSGQHSPISRMQPNEAHRFRPYKAVSLFWATDNGTFLHVPFDCTRKHVEDPEREEPESDSDERDLDDARVGEQHTNVQPHAPEQPQETWRRLRFYHHYPGPPNPTISLARYTGGSNEVGGTLPLRWMSTLIPAVHKPAPEVRYDEPCQLAGDLPLLLGLVAFNHADKNSAITAVKNLFPPSQGTTHWTDNEPFGNPLCHCDSREYSLLIISSVLAYCTTKSLTPAHQVNAEAWWSKPSTTPNVTMHDHDYKDGRMAGTDRSLLEIS
jgi:hypothetical protein